MPASARLSLVVVVTLVAALMLAACGGRRPSTAPLSPGTDGTPIQGKITVFAASSLTDVFKTIGASFQEQHPGVTVEFSFASSSALESQIEQKAEDGGLLRGRPVTFARNLPVIVVPSANKAGVTAAKDLAKPGLKLVLAAPEVPIGSYARQIIDRLAADPASGVGFKGAVLKNLVSNEANVRAVLSKVELGEADAGIVYRTDALVSGDRVTVIAIPEASNVIATYPISIVKDAKNPEAAAAFIAFTRGPDGAAALQEAGFDAAP
jgi:molybdate transport system substrate-binding protein